MINIDVYETYYRNLTPSGLKVSKDGGSIRIDGFYTRKNKEMAKKRTLRQGDPVIYKDNLWYVSQRNGKVGIINMASGAWGSDYPFVSEDKIDKSKLADMYGNSNIELSAEQSTVLKDGGKIKGDYVLYSENDEGRSEFISAHKTYRGAKTKMTRLWNSGDYNHIGIVSTRDWEMFHAPHQLKSGGGIDKSKQVFGKNKEGVFELPYEVAIYVPSTQDVDRVISLNEMESRVKEVSEYLSNLFGGYTSTDTIGGFVASNGELVNEEVTKVTSFSQIEDFEKHKEELLKQIGKWGKDWGQEAIGLEYEGDLFYVPQEYPLKKMKRGGEISSNYFTGGLSFLNW